MKSALTDSYDFAKIIQGNNVYVDKTAILHQLITSASGSRYFISRPRRFGKSLMISTLECIFNAQRELFKELAISKTDYAWPRVPVIHIDMSAVVADDIVDLKQNIVSMIRLQAAQKELDVDFSVFNTPSSCFNAFLCEASRKFREPVAILIDEYDAPVNRLIESGIDHFDASSMLHDFYLQLKVNDANIRFMMMTGVSKFAKLSVFSGLNNVKDLTLEPECAGLLGYTPEEITQYFSEHIDAFASAVGRTPNEILSSLLEWYDGYRFSPYSEVRVANPVSLASSLEKRRFDPFWDETGHSSLIYKHLKNRIVVPVQLNGFVADKSDLNFCNISDAESPALLFQTGYLTIDKVLPDAKLQFKIPNKEVFQALTSGLLTFIFRDAKRKLLSGLSEALDRLKANPSDIETVLNETLTAAFNAIPYDWTVKDEPEARRMFLFYCHLMGAVIIGEVHSPMGRADAILELPNAVFVFEFKYDHTAEEALAQAENMNYGGPFLNGRRVVYLVGVNYNSKKRNVDSPCCKVLKKTSNGTFVAEALPPLNNMGSSGPTGPFRGNEESSSASKDEVASQSELSAEVSGAAIGGGKSC